MVAWQDEMSCDFHVCAMRRHSSPLQRPLSLYKHRRLYNSFLHQTITLSPSAPTPPPSRFYTVCSFFLVLCWLGVLTISVFFAVCCGRFIMSAAERVQNHPVYVQAQGKANYYVSQLDKEVICDNGISRFGFSNLVLTRSLPAQQLPCLESSRATYSSSQGLYRHRLRLSPPHSPCLQRARCPRFKPPRLGSSRLLVPQGPRDTGTSG